MGDWVIGLLLVIVDPNARLGMTIDLMTNVEITNHESPNHQ